MRGRLKEDGNDISQDAQTNDSGEYQFNNLLTGDYTVTVEAANFKTQALTKSLRIMPTGPADKFS